MRVTPMVFHFCGLDLVGGNVMVLVAIGLRLEHFPALCIASCPARESESDSHPFHLQWRDARARAVIDSPRNDHQGVNSVTELWLECWVVSSPTPQMGVEASRLGRSVSSGASCIRGGVILEWRRGLEVCRLWEIEGGATGVKLEVAHGLGRVNP
jgi:hypothetical protein